jgi:hypothetical protein
MSDTIDDLVHAIESAIAIMRSRPETRDSVDIENLRRVRQVLEGMDPLEIDEILEAESDEEE